MPTIETLNPDVPLYARTGINLASEGLGARAVSCTNEFFAPLERMLHDSVPEFFADRFDDHGNWMDGWQTQRRRDGGHDDAVVKLAAPRLLLGCNVDKAQFTVNYAPGGKIETVSLPLTRKPARSRSCDTERTAAVRTISLA
ncbi:MAG: hypothetical protein NXH97_16655 [Rhodobacteraceae bacterium]|nr:hypothetical protein [Paracoccaceae bacterium]